jgi:hypothetical protein
MYSVYSVGRQFSGGVWGSSRLRCWMFRRGRAGPGPRGGEDPVVSGGENAKRTEVTPLDSVIADRLVRVSALSGGLTYQGEESVPSGSGLQPRVIYANTAARKAAAISVSIHPLRCT